MEHQEAVSTLASERYLLGEMTEAERESFEDHFFSCAECADEVVVSDKMRAGVRAGFAAAPTVARRAWRPAVAIPWAAAASLSLVAGYASYRAASMPQQLAGPMALAPLTLRAATRGAELTVPARAGGVVTLAIDLGGAAFDNGLTYEIRSESGHVVGNGEAPTPAPGAPLLLLIPSSVFKSSGHFVLSLRDPRGGGGSPNEYRFSVQVSEK